MVEQSLTSVDAVEGEQMSVGVKFCSLFHSNPTLDMTLVTTTSTWTMIMVTLNTLSVSVSARLSSPERSSLPWSMVAAMVLTPVLIIFLTIIIKNLNQSTERGKYWTLSYSIETSDCKLFCDQHPINTETLRHRSQVQFPFSNMMFFQSISECFQFITRLTNHLLS